MNEFAPYQSKILQISCSWDSKLGGPVQVARYISRRLLQGYPNAVTMIVGKKLDSWELDDFRRIQVPTFFANRYGLGIRLLSYKNVKLIRNQDLVLCHGYYLFSTLVVLIFAKRRVLVMPHGSLELFKSKKGVVRKYVYDSIVRISYKLKKNKFQFIVASNSEVISVSSKFPQVKCSVVGLGVEESKKNTRVRKYSESTRLATLGRIHTIKRIDLAIKAVSILERDSANKNLHLFITGEGDSKKIKELIADLNIGDRITFTGWLDRKKLDTFLSEVDIIVQPSDNENFAISIAEAIVRGIPVIVTDQVGMSEFVKTYVTGIVIPPNDEIALAEAIKNIIFDIEQYSGNCLKHGRLLSWEHVFSSRWEPIIDEWN